MSHDHDHEHAHDHSPGPLADASVRRGQPNDAPAVGQVQSVVWRETYAGIVPEVVLAELEPQALASVWRRSLETPPAGVHRLLVALAGAQVVGFAAVGPSQDPDGGGATAELTNLCVHPAARRQGHGSRLLNACVDILREAGAEELNAWCLATADATRAFLSASGFDADGAHRERIVGPGGELAGEVRLGVRIVDAPESEDPTESHGDV